MNCLVKFVEKTPKANEQASGRWLQIGFLLVAGRFHRRRALDPIRTGFQAEMLPRSDTSRGRGEASTRMVACRRVLLFAPKPLAKSERRRRRRLLLPPLPLRGTDAATPRRRNVTSGAAFRRWSCPPDSGAGSQFIGGHHPDHSPFNVGWIACTVALTLDTLAPRPSGRRWISTGWISAGRGTSSISSSSLHPCSFLYLPSETLQIRASAGWVSNSLRWDILDHRGDCNTRTFDWLGGSPSFGEILLGFFFRRLFFSGDILFGSTRWWWSMRITGFVVLPDRKLVSVVRRSPSLLCLDLLERRPVELAPTPFPVEFLFTARGS